MRYNPQIFQVSGITLDNIPGPLMRKQIDAYQFDKAFMLCFTGIGQKFYLDSPKIFFFFIVSTVIIHYLTTIIRTM